MKQLEVKIHGTTPLLMNSNQGVNPLHPVTRSMKVLTAKKNRTEDDETEILHHKWILGLYADEKIGIHIPSANVEAMFKNAAKSRRKGSIAKQSSTLTVSPVLIPLEYDGPKDPDALWNDPNRKYADVRIGKIKQSSVPLCRPRFNNWGLTFRIRYDESKFDREEIIELFTLSGTDVGLCDYREKYGHFDIVEVKDI
jgi:hypothetical protein